MSTDAETDTEAPTGVAEEIEEQPLGPPTAEPDGHGEPQRGEHAMPGIPTEGEPPSAG